MRDAESEIDSGINIKRSFRRFIVTVIRFNGDIGNYNTGGMPQIKNFEDFFALFFTMQG